MPIILYIINIYKKYIQKYVKNICDLNLNWPNYRNLTVCSGGYLCSKCICTAFKAGCALFKNVATSDSLYVFIIIIHDFIIRDNNNQYKQIVAYTLVEFFSLRSPTLYRNWYHLSIEMILLIIDAWKQDDNTT